MMSLSISSCVSSLAIGRLLKFTGRLPVFIFGGAANMLVLVVMVIWDPEGGKVWHLVSMAVVIGFSRATFSTISSSKLSGRYF